MVLEVPDSQSSTPFNSEESALYFIFFFKKNSEESAPVN